MNYFNLAEPRARFICDAPQTFRDCQRRVCRSGRQLEYTQALARLENEIGKRAARINAYANALLLFFCSQHLNRA